MYMYMRIHEVSACMVFIKKKLTDSTSSMGCSFEVHRNGIELTYNKVDQFWFFFVMLAIMHSLEVLKSGLTAARLF